MHIKEVFVNLKYGLMAALVLWCGLSPLVGAPVEPDISFSIRYYDKRIYYLEKDPIQLQITLTNNSSAPFRFKLAEDRAFSLDFDVRTTTNRAVEAADALVRRRSGSQQVYFREISVETGESFSFVEDLRDYAALNQSGSYVIQARIYPELYYTAGNTGGTIPAGITPGRTLAGTGGSLESNRLSLTVRPPPIPGPDGVPLELDVETNAVLVREKLPPDEVVSYLLTARQKSQWEKFFLYLDLQAMLARDAYRRRQWNAESEEGRRRMIARYRQELQSAVIDGDISLIPKDYLIERTLYNASEGTVTALEYFQVGTYTEKKRYTWYLRKKDDVWTIVDYSVVNLGTE
jgi:hypothetical protein